MARRPSRVGIIGMEPGRSWAARAHVPALRALADDFEILAVANRDPRSSGAAAAALGIPYAFADADALIASPDVDVVVVAVRVSRHLELVRAALDGGKHVYCEWPLGNGLAEAEEMAGLARTRNVLNVVGTQARVAPQVRHAKWLIADGHIGEVLSTTLVSYGGQWGGTVADRANGAYLLDAREGASMLTIPVGHTLAGVQEALGRIESVSAVLATRRPTALVAGTGEALPVTVPDQVVVSGLLSDGVPISLHYRGGMPRGGDGLLWEINGTRGDLRIRAPSGHLQLAPLTLEAVRGEGRTFETLQVPTECFDGLPVDAAIGNVARNYASMARDLREGTRDAPTFDDAVGLHRVLAAIESSAETGRRTGM